MRPEELFMGSISGSLNSLATPTTVSSSSSSSSSASSNPTGIFTGSSAYAGDLENVVTRAVELASLPIQLLSNQQSLLNSQANEVSNLSNLLGNLQSSVKGIDNAMNGASFQASYSANGVVSASLAAGATQGVYSIDVSQMGVSASSLSSGTWSSTPASGGGGSQYTLVVGANEYAFSPASNSAQDVAAAINAQYSSMVQATAVNVGTSSSPDYRISLRSNSYGPMNLDLVQMPQTPVWTSLQQAANPNPASYSTSLSTSTWDPSQLAGSTMSLVIGGVSQSVTINNGDYSVQGVAADINAQFGSQVQATVVNQGTDNSPDYRISLQSATPGNATLDLQYTPNGGIATSLQTQGAAATYSTSLSPNAWSGAADPAGTRTMYQLVIGPTTLQFAPPDNSAASVASYINSQYGSMVQATVVNQGTAQSPDYRISLRSTTQGTSTNLDIQTIAATSFQTPQTTGKVSKYSVDGGPTVSSTSETVNVSNGVTLTLVGQGSTDVTVSASTSALSSALSSFASAYNSVVSELNQQRGKGGGALQGDPIVSQLQQIIGHIGTYITSSGSVNSLSSLGLTFDSSNNGNLDYDPTVLYNADTSNAAGVVSFLGSASGGGFLGAAATALSGVTDPFAGLLATTESSLQTQITHIGSQITTKQNQVNQLQQTLTSQMAAADASLAAMEQQYSELTQIYQAQNTANLQYANGG